MESPLVEIRYKAFFNTNHSERFLVYTVRRAWVPRVGDSISVGEGRPIAKVSDVLGQLDGSASVYLELPNDHQLYLDLLGEGWELQESHPDIAT